MFNHFGPEKPDHIMHDEWMDMQKRKRKRSRYVGRFIGVVLATLLANYLWH